MLIPHLTIKRPNGWEYWFEKDGTKICKGGFKEPLTDAEITALDESIIIKAPEPVVEEPDLETAALAVVTLKALSTSTVIPPELLGALEQLTTGITTEAMINPDLGVSATVTATKLIERLNAKGSFELSAQISQALQIVQQINGGKI